MKASSHLRSPPAPSPPVSSTVSTPSQACIKQQPRVAQHCRTPRYCPVVLLCHPAQFNPVRVGFAWQSGGAVPGGREARGGTEVWTRDVLNLGVSPDALVQLMRRRLEELGGAVLERTGLEGEGQAGGAGWGPGFGRKGASCSSRVARGVWELPPRCRTT